MSHSKKDPHSAPFTDPTSAEPHYDDIIDKNVIMTDPAPTPPNKEPMDAGSMKTPDNVTAKTKDLDLFRVNAEGMDMTTERGTKISNNQSTLGVGTRGPKLFEDFMYTEKLAHFDRERIPERVVHARGTGAHGYFQVYKPLSKICKAHFLNHPEEKTPVFVRFSEVQGFRGVADTVRDIRGFAVKLYTREGNLDLVGNDTPVFFIQDPIKFPDFVHALKPEPHNEVPQGQSAHDTFWDYISLQPETLHNTMWNMSDRGIPRSYRMIEGFGIHSFRMVNEDGQSCFVRFHWKPLYGTTSLIWDEAQLIMGRDPDFHRKDLWQAIEAGDYPEWELGLQIIPEEDVDAFDFDILDPTKLIPEALVPVQRVGKMTLNRNPDNFFAEVEQSAFCPANIVPGIEFSDDPLLQGRIFAYVDTQQHRLGGPNFNELPINRSLCPVRNHHRDGFHRMKIEPGANYEPNSISGNWPREVPDAPAGGGFKTYPEQVEGKKVRRRSESFGEYYAQPRLFWLSQTRPEQMHIIDAFSFELSKVMRPYIRERVVDLLTRIDPDLASGVARNLGIELTKEQLSRELPKPVNGITSDPALSLYARGNQVLRSRIVALLIADGVSGKSVEAICAALQKEGAHPQFCAPRMGMIKTAEGKKIQAEGTFQTHPSVLVDAVIVPDGDESVQMLMRDGLALHYLRQAFKHLKVIGLHGKAANMRKAAGLENRQDEGVVTSGKAQDLMQAFLKGMSKHRIWARESELGDFAA